MTPAVAPTPVAPPPAPVEIRPRPRRRRWKRWLFTLLAVAGIGAIAAHYGARAWRTIIRTSKIVIPTAKVQRGDVTLTITARGELRGGNSKCCSRR